MCLHIINLPGAENLFITFLKSLTKIKEIAISIFKGMVT